MRNLMKRFSLCLFALALFASSAAQALPTYHVKVDTTGLSGPALMDFTFLANAGATPANALLSNFSGAFGATWDRSPGVAGSIVEGFVLGNADGGDYLTQTVSLGGLLSFDVSFDGAFATTGGIDVTQLSVALYNEDLSAYIGSAGNLAEFALLPQAGGVPGGVAVSVPGALADVTQVPEPSSLLLVLGAIAVLGLARSTPFSMRIPAQA